MIIHQDASANKKHTVLKHVIRAGVLVALLLLILFLKCCVFVEESGTPSPAPTKSPDDGVTIGVIDVAPKPEASGNLLQDMANDIVEENMFRVFIDTKIVIDADGTFRPRIQNTKANHNPCWVEITSPDGKVLYESDIIEPGYKIEQDTLSEFPSPGLTDAIAVFHVLTRADKSSAEAGSVNVKIQLSYSPS